ncbi:hypothetical protein B0O80DRAFT_533766 [Mortierella sp. GBAus27b]|nr:hypothetical protein B0O80DRAFT_533766 [Mortierella sp. GBAus27b]
MQHNNTNNNDNNNRKREGDPLPCGEPEVECGSPQGKRARLSPPASPWGAAAQGAVFSINKRKGEALSSEDSLEAGESSRAKRSRSSPAGPEEAVDVVLLEEDDTEVVFRLPSPVLRLGQLRQILRNLTPGQLEDLQRPLTESEVEDSLDSVAEGSPKPMVESSSHGLETQRSFSAAEKSSSSAPSARSLIFLAPLSPMPPPRLFPAVAAPPPLLMPTTEFTFSFPAPAIQGAEEVAPVLEEPPAIIETPHPPAALDPPLGPLAAPSCEFTFYFPIHALIELPPEGVISTVYEEVDETGAIVGMPPGFPRPTYLDPPPWLSEELDDLRLPEPLDHLEDQDPGQTNAPLNPLRPSDIIYPQPTE